MKKKLSLILSLILAAHINCFAENADDSWKQNTGEINLTDLSVTGDGVSVLDNKISITKGGDFEVFGELKNGYIYVNTDERVKLRLSGASITNENGPAIFFDNVDKGFITITEDSENYLTDGSEYVTEDADAALFSNDDLEIKGDGTLYVTGNYKHGIAGDDDVKIENGTLNINSYEHGIKVNDTLSVTGGTITVNAKTGKGIKAGLELIIDDGNLNITSEQNEGLESKGILTINGGDINITAKDDGINTGNEDTALEETRATGENTSANPRHRPQLPEGMIPPEGMTHPVNTNRPMRDDFGRSGKFGGMVDEETAAAHAVTINGGNIYINTECDGIDSNGNLTVNGGKLIIDGPAKGGNGPLDAQGLMSITGGTVISTSSAGMIQLPKETDSINTLSAYFPKNMTDTKLSIKDSATGDEILTLSPKNTYQALIVLSADLKEASEYAIYVNDEEYESFTVTNGNANVGNISFGKSQGGQFDDFNKGNRASRVNKDSIKVSLNGKNLTFNTAPVIKNDSTLVGFRAILEALGATVTWDDDTKTVTATKDDVKIVLHIGSYKAYVNNEEFTLLAAPEIINDTTMIPVRFVSEALDMNVEWDGTNKHVLINSHSF